MSGLRPGRGAGTGFSTAALRGLSLARGLRGFGAGALSVLLVLELSRAGYSTVEIGALLGLAMGAAAFWALALPGRVRFLHRRALLLGGATAWALGGFLLWYDLTSPAVLLLALALGGVVAGGADISPLGSLEQGSLALATPDESRTRAFVLYNLVGYVGTALGALLAGPLGGLTGPLMGLPSGPRDVGLLLYGVLGVALLPVYYRLTARRGPERPVEEVRPLSVGSRRPVHRLAALFTIDAFGGGMTANALVSLFLYLRFGASADQIGVILFFANVAAGASLVAALPLARRIGLIRTMVYTHLPSSALLIAFAFAPGLVLAGALWFARASLSQMDVPTRQSYTQAIVPREEGAAAAGYTTAARATQAFGGPLTGGLLGLGGPWLASPFAIAGAVKIAYDLGIYRSFGGIRPPEERPRRP